MPHRLSASGIGRVLLGTATVLFFLIALVVRDDPRWYVASGMCGVFWTLWDTIWDGLVLPLGDWIHELFTGGLTDTGGGLRPTLDDTIRLLEGHIAGGASRRVQIQAAIRLEEIYRTVKRDPARARAVIERVRGRFPDAGEFSRYD